MLKTHFYAFWTHFCQKNQISEFLLNKRKYDCWHGQQTVLIFLEKHRTKYLRKSSKLVQGDCREETRRAYKIPISALNGSL